MVILCKSSFLGLIKRDAVSEEEVTNANDRKSSSVKPENGTFTFQLNGPEIHSLPAWSMFLPIYPYTNKFALITRR